MPAVPHPAPSAREQLIAVALALVCGLLFVGKAIWPGFALLPFPPEATQPWLDDAVARGASEQDFLAGNASGGDKLVQVLPWDAIKQRGLREGRLPLWSRELGGGSPFVAQAPQVYQPWNVLYLLLPAEGMYGLLFVLHQVVIGYLAYRFQRRLGLSHAAALCGEVSLVLGLWVQARVHHFPFLSAAMPLFGMLSATLDLCRDPSRRASIAALALWTALSILAGFPAVTAQVVALTAVLALVACGEMPRRGPALWRIGFGLALGAVVAAPQLVPMAVASSLTSRGDVTPETMRRIEEVALTAGHLLGAAWPDLLHWPADFFYGSVDVTRHSWAAYLCTPSVLPARFSFPETAFAFGLPMLALVLRGATAQPRRWPVFFLTAGLVALCFALALPGTIDLSCALRGDRFVGDQKRYLFTVAMTLPIVAAFGVDRWRAHGPGRAAPALLAALCVVSVAVWVFHLRGDAELQDFWARTLAPRFGATAEMFNSVVGIGETAANASHLRATFLRASILALAGLAVLFAWRRRGAAFCITALTATDLLLAGRGTFVAVANERLAAPGILAPVLAARDQAADPVRFHRLLVTRADGRTPHLLTPNLGAYLGLEDLGLYAPQPPKRYEQLMLAIEPDAPGKASIASGGAGAGPLRDARSLQHPLLDVLGCRFVLSAAPLDAPLPPGLADKTPAGYAGQCRLYERTTVLPWASFVTDARVLVDERERLARLADRSRPVRDEVILEDAAAPRPDGVPARFQVLAQRIAPAHVVVEVETDRAGYLRLADPWDPGFVATLDGDPAPIWIADHYLCALWLTPGRHRVELQYAATWLQVPPYVALLGLALCAALALVRVRRRAPHASV